MAGLVDQKLGMDKAERKIIICRVRNAKIRSQYIDVAMIVSYFITKQNENTSDKFSPQSFQRYSKEFAMLQIADPADCSPVISISSKADLIQAYQAFRAQHDQDDE